jgi:hypothetical protein
MRRLYVPTVPQADNLRVAVLEMMHAAPWAVHVGRRRTAYITKQMFWWPNMHSDIEHYVQHCDLCQRNKARHQNAENMLVPLPVPNRAANYSLHSFTSKLQYVKGLSNYM